MLIIDEFLQINNKLMLDKEFYISKLISGHLQGILSPLEEMELNDWLKISEENQAFFDIFKNEAELNKKLKEYHSLKSNDLWDKTILKIKSSEATINIATLKRPNLLIYKITAAAILIISIGVGSWFYLKKVKPLTPQNVLVNISPGKNAATLTLSNGKRIRLSASVKGQVAQESGVKISKTTEGKLVYTVSDKQEQDNTKTNILSTERGETYELVLPDGSKVWLNSASTLKYPATFANLNTRKVELSGEAYFEVKKDKQHPFIVESEKQQVQVLGTHFNINSYADENEIKTTLLEGSVKISAKLNSSSLTKILLPGQQSILSGQKLQTEEVVADDVIAWKDGLFVFNDEPLSMAMRKISRWYNVDIVFKDSKLENLSSFGTISKYSEVSKVLVMMEKTGHVSFSVYGKTIFVTNPKNKNKQPLINLIHSKTKHDMKKTKENYY